MLDTVKELTGTTFFPAGVLWVTQSSFPVITTEGFFIRVPADMVNQFIGNEIKGAVSSLDNDFAANGFGWSYVID